MANLKLGSTDVKQLLATYESKQRQLKFELDQTTKMIRNFKSILPEIEAAEMAQLVAIANAPSALADVSVPEIAKAVKATGKKRGRPAKAKVVAQDQPAEAPVRRGRKKSKGRAAGYRLSEYDLLVFKALDNTGQAMINSEIVSFIENDHKANGKKADSDEIQTMVVRSLQKLANRRDDIRKVPYEGRGMAYALPGWLNSKGDLKRKHSRK